MNLVSCPNCGIVYDLDYVDIPEIPDPEYEENDGCTMYEFQVWDDGTMYEFQVWDGDIV